MDKKEKFDLSIKRSFEKGYPILPGIKIEKGEDVFGRVVREKYRNTYFNETYGNDLVSIIDKEPKEEIERELKDHFLCVAASSRLALASFTMYDNKKIKKIKSLDNKEIQELKFEHSLDIPGGKSAHMDVYIKDDTEHFIEVKCHEIFDRHKQIKISTKYDNEENEAYHKLVNEFNLDLSKTIKKGNAINFRFYWDDFGIESKTYHFDLKQFLCHLMGIMSNTTKTENKKFTYLFYKNNDAEFKSTYQELEYELKKIKKAFNDILDEYNIEFTWIYNDGFDTIKSI